MSKQEKMKAIVARGSGPPEVLQLREVEQPVPKDDEVLVRIRAATVTAGDVVLRKLPRLMYLPMRLFGVRRKEIPGHEFAGVVASAGRDVRRFKEGDSLFGTTTGLSVGANAEYVCLPADGMLATKPPHASYDEAAALPVGGMTALHFLRQGNLRDGQKVLIYGASGSVGTFAVQLARAAGAEVTGVCSTRNVALVRALGADRVIDYTREDLATSGKRYDLVFDAVGKLSTSAGQGVLLPAGSFVSVSKGTAKESTDALLHLAELVEAGKLKPIIDRRFPLSETAEAHRYVESGRKRGNVVITVGGGQ